MSKKSTETPKASSKPDDLIEPKTKGGKSELTELSEEEVEKVTRGVFYKYSGYKYKFS